jgi:hypothetical protein
MQNFLIKQDFFVNRQTLKKSIALPFFYENKTIIQKNVFCFWKTILVARRTRKKQTTGNLHWCNLNTKHFLE